MTHGSAMADLFFRADKVLSDADQARTSELRRNYRQWRQGDEGVEPHADPVALKHIATIEETRSRAKLRRVKTYAGNNLGAMGGASKASFSAAASPLRQGSSSSDRAQVRRHAALAVVPRGAWSARQAASRACAPAAPALGFGYPRAPAQSCSSPQRARPPYPQVSEPGPSITPFVKREPSAPMLAVGGCPFPQGQLPPPVGLATGRDPAMMAAVPGGCPFRQAPTVTPPPTDANLLSVQSGLVAPTAGLGGGAAPAAAGVPELTAEQLAAFQQAYIKALQEQKDIMAKSMRQGAGRGGAQGGAPAAAGGRPTPHQQPRPQQSLGQQGAPRQWMGHSQPQSHAHGAAGNGVAWRPASCNGAGSSEPSPPALMTDCEDDDEAMEGSVLATSCAHGPLVTHPHLSSSSGMLMSVFPSSHESWLYVLMAGEFGAPFNIGLSAKGVVYGRLTFRAKMQQWVLLHVEPAEWEAVALETLIPASVHTWGEPIPPKGDSRWICFPYLDKEPASVLNLPRLLSANAYCLDVKPNVGPIVMQTRLPLPEATFQRDVKAIGARPAKKEAPKSARKRPIKAQLPVCVPAATRPGMSVAGTAAMGMAGMAGMAPAADVGLAPGQAAAGLGTPAKRARGPAVAVATPFDPRRQGEHSGGALHAFPPAPAANGYPAAHSTDLAMRQLLQGLGYMQRQQQGPGVPLPPSGSRPIPPSRSMLELLHYLEGAAKSIGAAQQQQSPHGQLGGSASSESLTHSMPGLPDSASVISLLGLLRSDSMQQSLAALESQRPEGAPAGSSELSLARLVRAASQTDMASHTNGGSSHGGMPPPQFTPWSNGRGLRAPGSSLPGAPSMEDFAELQALSGSLKESPSVTSLIDLVRSRWARRLLRPLTPPLCSQHALACCSRKPSTRVRQAQASAASCSRTTG